MSIVKPPPPADVPPGSFARNQEPEPVAMDSRVPGRRVPRSVPPR